MLPVVLAITALGFAFMGLIAVAAPERVTRQFGIPNLDADGRNEVRAVYGGFGIAVAAALVAALFAPDWRVPAAAAVAVALGGMTLGRAYSAVIDKRIGHFPAIYGSIEAVTALVMIWAIAVH
jgi:hypothetical protein